MSSRISGDTFAIVILIGTVLYLIAGAIIFITANKKGIDVSKNRFDLRVGLSLIAIFMIIPILLSDMSFPHKIFVSITGVAVALGHYFAVDKISKWLKTYLEKDKEESV